jgi:hypothetical protein
MPTFIVQGRLDPEWEVFMLGGRGFGNSTGMGRASTTEARKRCVWLTVTAVGGGKSICVLELVNGSEAGCGFLTVSVSNRNAFEIRAF